MSDFDAQSPDDKMHPGQLFGIAIGAGLCGCTYNLGIILAGLWLRDPVAWKFALASAGFGYLTAVCHVSPGLKPLDTIFFIVALAFGVLAGIDLLIFH